MNSVQSASDGNDGGSGQRGCPGVLAGVRGLGGGVAGEEEVVGDEECALAGGLGFLRVPGGADEGGALGDLGGDGEGAFQADGALEAGDVWVEDRHVVPPAGS